MEIEATGFPAVFLSLGIAAVVVVAACVAFKILCKWFF